MFSHFNLTGLATWRLKRIQTTDWCKI